MTATANNNKRFSRISSSASAMVRQRLRSVEAAERAMLIYHAMGRRVRGEEMAIGAPLCAIVPPSVPLGDTADAWLSGYLGESCF